MSNSTVMPMKFDSGNTAWMLISSGLVMLMTPGLAMFYGGLVRAKSALNMVMQNIMALGVVSIQWFIMGWSLCFTPGNEIYGSLHKMFFIDTEVDRESEIAPGTGIPEMVVCFYQMMFAIITPALITGATADRFKLQSYLVFIFAWATLVYDPICHMVWHPNGWMNKNTGAGPRVMDFAGGVVVHCSAGTSALVSALVLGRRKGFPNQQMAPHAPLLVVLGTALLWFGWYGFNAGSALTAGSLATGAFISTHIAGAFGGTTWTITEWIVTGRTSATGTCVGFVAGLATVTPASGFIRPLPAMAIGVVGSLICFAGCRMRMKLHYDDALDVFACHGLASAGGVLMTAIFTDKGMVASPTSGLGGWLNHYWKAMGWQLCGVMVSAGWAAVGTWVILKTIEKTLGLRVKEDEEESGLDETTHGEKMFDFLPSVVGSQMVSGEHERRKGLEASLQPATGVTQDPELLPKKKAVAANNLMNLSSPSGARSPAVTTKGESGVEMASGTYNPPKSTESTVMSNDNSTMTTTSSAAHALHAVQVAAASPAVSSTQSAAATATADAAAGAARSIMVSL